MAYKFVDLSTITEAGLIEVLDHNAREAAFTREEIKKMKAAAKPKTIAPSIIIENPKREVIEVPDRSDFEDEVEYYFSQIRELKPSNFQEKVHLCLPRRSNKNYEKIILRLKLESIRTIKEINEVIRDFADSSDPEEIKMFRDEVVFEQQKMAYYNHLLSPEEKEEETVIEEESSNRLIFVPTNGGNIRIFDDVERVPAQYQEELGQLFLSIKDGSFKNVKRFTNNASINGLCEVKDNHVRVVFARIDENTYAIITAFVKKTQKDKAYSDNLKNKAADYKAVAEILKRSLNNQEFLELHQQYEDELFRQLGYDPVTKQFVKGGK